MLEELSGSRPHGALALKLRGLPFRDRSRGQYLLEITGSQTAEGGVGLSRPLNRLASASALALAIDPRPGGRAPNLQRMKTVARPRGPDGFCLKRARKYLHQQLASTPNLTMVRGPKKTDPAGRREGDLAVFWSKARRARLRQGAPQPLKKNRPAFRPTPSELFFDDGPDFRLKI